MNTIPDTLTFLPVFTGEMTLVRKRDPHDTRCENIERAIFRAEYRLLVMKFCKPAQELHLPERVDLWWNGACYYAEGARQVVTLIPAFPNIKRLFGKWLFIWQQEVKRRDPSFVYVPEIDPDGPEMISEWVDKSDEFEVTISLSEYVFNLLEHSQDSEAIKYSQGG